MPPPEQVYVVPRSVFRPDQLSDGLRLIDFAPYAHLMATHGYFVARQLAEATSDLKQIIPYVYLWHDGRIFLYRRRRGGGEAGLWDRTSAGFGGHINPIDTADSPFDLIMNCALRELGEEVRLLEPPGSLTPMGILNDELDPVGARHLGVVFRLDLRHGRLRIRESASIARVGRGFLTRAAILRHADTLESWSRLLLDAGDGHCFLPLAPPPPGPAHH